MLLPKKNTWENYTFNNHIIPQNSGTSQAEKQEK